MEALFSNRKKAETIHMHKKIKIIFIYQGMIIHLHLLRNKTHLLYVFDNNFTDY